MVGFNLVYNQVVKDSKQKTPTPLQQNLLLV